MKITALLVSSFIVLISALPTPEILLEKQNLDGVYSIAENYKRNIDSLSSNFDNGIVYPKQGTVWHVGQKVSVVFDESLPKNETVAIFFYQQTDVLAGGSLEKKVFQFVVPPTAISPVDGYSELIAVRRMNNYLDAVDTVNVTVLP